MKRLNMTVEGQTEAAFVKSVLVPHLAKFDVFLGSPRFTGPNRRRSGKIPQGGMFNTFSHVLADMRDWLVEDRKPDARFTMMVDLYSLPNDFPGYDAGKTKPTGREQAEALELSLGEELDDSRFIPYLQTHEFEALVLVDPLRIQTLYDVSHPELMALCKECESFQTPEEINHGQHSHPKYRIEKRIPEYRENVDGPLLAEDIGLPTLRAKCPHFDAWLTSLEQLDA